MSEASVARPDFAAHACAYRLPLAAVVAELRNVLAAKLVAYVADVRETRSPLARLPEGQSDGSTPSSTIRVRTRRSISSRMGRTTSIGCPAGSSRAQSR